jgi:hypothetical protein
MKHVIKMISALSLVAIVGASASVSGDSFARGGNGQWQCYAKPVGDEGIWPGNITRDYWLSQLSAVQRCQSATRKECRSIRCVPFGAGF